MITNLKPRILALMSLVIGLFAVTGGAVVGILVSHVDPIYVLLGVIGLVIGAIALFRLEWGLYTLVFITYINLSDVLITVHHIPSVARVFVPALVGLILIRWLFLKDRFSNSWQSTALLLAGYGFVIFLSLFYATDFERALTGFTDYIKDALIVIVITLLLTRGSVLRRVIWSLLAAGIFLGTITTYQQLMGAFHSNFWGFARPNDSVIGTAPTFRVSGPVSSNFYALIMVVLVPLAVERLWHEKNVVLRAFALWALIAAVLSVIFTFSRGGFLALVIVLALLLVNREYRSQPALIFFAIVLGIGLFQFVPASYVERIQTLALVSSGSSQSVLEDKSFRGRLSENLVAWQMFADHPLSGVGYWNYENNYLDYSAELGLDPRYEDRQPHNLFLELAAETGFMGLLAFGLIVWFLFSGLHRAKKDLRVANIPQYYHMINAFNIAVIGYLAGSLFLHMAYPRYFWLLAGIAFAIPQVAAYELAHQQKAKNQAVTRKANYYSRTAEGPLGCDFPKLKS